MSLRLYIFSIVVLTLLIAITIPCYSESLDNNARESVKQPIDDFFPSPGTLERGEDPVKLILGWRVQLASLHFENEATRYADSVQALLHQEVHVLFRDGSYKVQAGDFLEKEPAFVYRDTLRTHGFPNAWVVRARVLSGDRDSGEENDFVVDTLAEVLPEAAGVPAPASTFEFIEMKPGYSYEGEGNGWRVQIMTLYQKPKSHAEDIAKNAQIQIGMATYVYHNTASYKVRMGDFLKLADAQKAKKRIRNLGYPDAYIVKCYINLVQN